MHSFLPFICEGVYHPPFQFEPPPLLPPPRLAHFCFYHCPLPCWTAARGRFPTLTESEWGLQSISPLMISFFNSVMRHQHPAHSKLSLSSELINWLIGIIRLLSPIVLYIYTDYLTSIWLRDWYDHPHWLLYCDILRLVFICCFWFSLWVWLCCGSQSKHHFCCCDSSKRLRFEVVPRRRYISDCFVC